MKRHIALLFVVAAALAVLAGGCAAVLYVHSPSLFWVPLGLLVLVFLGLLILLIGAKRIFTDWIRRLVGALDPEQQSALQRFPLPALLLGMDGEVLFANDRFSTEISDGISPAFGTSVQRLFSELTESVLSEKSVVELVRGERKFTAHISVIGRNKKCRYVVYFIDNTELKDIAEEYAESRPVVLQVCIDNLEETTEHLRAGDRARISGQIETMLEDWITAGNGVLQKYGNERFVAVTEHRHLQKMIADRFSLVSRVRESFPETDNNITLSVGVGEGATIEECRRMASQALDMALSRGGDQVAVKTLNGYDFFGGQSQGVERRTKVRTRIVADSLRDLITGSDRVIVTGHRMSDLDCLGSAVALAVTARNLGAQAYVCARRMATMAGQLMDRYVDANQGDLFIEPDTAQGMMTNGTLLIIVDTHSAAMLDAPELYAAAKRVVVIDHHRRMVNYIQDAVLTYHESASSSACELVTELLPYLYKEKLGRLEAESLLAGIMLDTRNFVLRTGVRTFEAAAYLRSLGADTVAVKKLFSESLEQYRYKNDLISAAQMYRNTAITASEADYSDHRTAAAQAADDLLTVQGVLASFVITRMGGSVNISARSFGECNVQLIMEALGGGGHLTMAATQMTDVTIHEAASRLTAAIDKYFSTKK